MIKQNKWIYGPRGKESTEVQKTQNKGKETENSYRKLKSSRWTGTRTHTRKQNQNISMTRLSFSFRREQSSSCDHIHSLSSD